MPNARVGALPQTSMRDDGMYHDHQDRGRGIRQHGMTMEDLKKQTAIRLAEEHHQMRSGARQSQQTRQTRNHRHATQPQAQQAFSQIPMSVHLQPQHEIRSNPLNRYKPMISHQENNNSEVLSGNPLHRNLQYMRKDQGTRSSHQFHNQRPVEQPKPQMHQQSQQLHPYPDAQGMVNTLNTNNNGAYVGQRHAERFSETSSIHSDYECGTSNTEHNDVCSIISASSNTRLHPSNTHDIDAISNSSLQAAASKIKYPSKQNKLHYMKNEVNGRRTSQNPVNPTGIISSASSHGNNRGSNTPTTMPVPSAVFSRPDHNQFLNHRQQQETSGHTYLNRQIQQHQHYPPVIQHTNRDHHPNISTTPPMLHEEQNGMKVSSLNRPIHQQHFNNQNKLPHGLTVHELKEMTRARLAAEAAVEKGNQNSPSSTRHKSTNDVNRRVFPESSASSQGSRSQTNKRNKNKNVPHSSITRQQQSQQQPVENSQSWQRNMTHQEQLLLKPSQIAHQHHQFNPSILNQGRESHMTQNDILYQFSHVNRQNRPHLDSMDSGSVTSFNSTIASEYLGSEPMPSCLGPSIHQPSNDDDMLFVRSWSYPSGNSTNNAVGDGATSSTSYFDSERGGNSRRRLGSSPPGFQLEVAHEDRPFSVIDELILPGTASTELAKGNRTLDDLSQRSMDSFLSHSNKLQSFTTNFGNEDRSLVVGQDSSQRRSIGQESNVRNRQMEQQQFPPLQDGYVRGTSSNGELPNWVAESVLGTPILQGEKNVQTDFGNKEKGVEGVFRAQRNPVGFSNKDVLSSALSYGYPYSDESLLGKRDGDSASWGGPTSTIHGQSVADFFNHDFANLFSSNSKHDALDNNGHSNIDDQLFTSTLKSRMDPELVNSPSSVDRVVSCSFGSDFGKQVETKSDPASTVCAHFVSTPATTPPPSSSKSQRNRYPTSSKKKRDKGKKKRDFLASNQNNLHT